MLDGNGDSARALPPRLEEALRAARAGHHVSFEVLRGAVCSYIDELSAGGHEDDAIRRHVRGAFHDVKVEPRVAPASWNDELIDELIAWCRDRAG